MADLTKTNAIDDLKNKYLTFNIGDNIYALSLSSVTEIIGVQLTTKVPSLPNYIMGLINLRGKIVPVINGRKKLGYKDKEIDDKTCTVIVEYNDYNIGLLVDNVNEVANVDEASITPPPNVGKKGKEKYIKSVLKIQDDVVLALDCNEFFSQD